jgi:uncharacterized protein (TIGR03437 family)
MTKRLSLFAVILFFLGMTSINAQPFAYMTAVPLGENYVDEPSILVLDLATKKIVATIRVPGKASPSNPSLYHYMSPVRIAFTPDGSRVIATANVMDYYDSYISPSESLLVIDTATNQTVKKISLGSDGCHKVAISPDSQYAFTACEYSGTVKIINLNNGTITKSIDVRGQPTNIAIMPDGSRLYVDRCGFTAQSLCIINTATNTLTTTLNINSKKIVIAPDGSRLYLLLSDGNIAVLNAATNAKIATIDMSWYDWANDMVMAPDGKYIYTIGAFGVTVIDATFNKALRRVDLPGSTAGGTLAISPDGKYVYVPDGSQIWVVDTGTNTLSDKITVRTSSNFITIGYVAITMGPARKPVFSAAGIANAAGYQGGGVAPGEIITIFGSAIGPPTLTTMRLNSAGLVDNSLADTRVLFDGVPAPLIYVWQNQNSAVVPYAVAGKLTTQAQVEYKGLKSEPVTLRVIPAIPGIFTLDSSGKGQAAALNEDATINSAANPARRGSIVVLYATGEGQTSPPGIDGKVASNVLPRPLLPVSVQLGGVPAEVLYAGAAPGLVAGVLQINVRVPLNGYFTINPDNTVWVAFTVGNASSQPGVTIAVR